MARFVAPVVLVVLVVAVRWVGCSDSSPSPNPMPPAPIAESLSPETLRDQLDEAIDFTYSGRRLNLRDHAAWQIIHGCVAFKRDFQVETADGTLVPVIDYVLQGGRMNGWNFEPGIEFEGRRGLRSIVESGSKSGQGHYDQWLGYLAESGLAPEQTFVWDGRTYTIADVVRQVEWDIPRNTVREFSWTLMGLTTYRSTNHTWTASDGKQWSIEDLVREEVSQDLNSAACGGSHRLCGLTIALNRHLAQGGELTGAWADADKRIKESIAFARMNQNMDGSFSSNFFARPGLSSDLTHVLRTTGHTFEFIVLAVDDKELQQPWIRRAAERLSEAFLASKRMSVECGALYHATHGLILYRDRIYGPRKPSGVPLSTGDSVGKTAENDK